MKVLCPQGIGDVTWALHKVQSVRDALDPHGRIDIILPCSRRDPLQDRALDFVRRFSFVDSVDMRVNYAILNEPPLRRDGCYNYIEDGWYEFPDGRYCALIPNAPLEHGVRLEQWLPQYPIRWDIFSDFRISPDERAYADRLHRSVGDYCVFYPGPLDGNLSSGHNRNMLWKYTEWIALGDCIRRDFGLKIVVVGAPYDLDYYADFISPSLNGSSSGWLSIIGDTSIGQLYAVTSRAKFVISYQAGVGIVATYLGTPTGIFWRPWGDSISGQVFLSFKEEMASAWVPPTILSSGKHLPLIYGRHKVDYIMSEIHSRKWAE